MENDILSQASAAAHLSRERDAFLYICAWDRSDHNTMCNTWERALNDVELANMLRAIDTELIAELDDDEAGEDNEEEDKRVHEKALHLMKQYNEKGG